VTSDECCFAPWVEKTESALFESTKREGVKERRVWPEFMENPAERGDVTQPIVRGRVGKGSFTPNLSQNRT